MGVFVILVQVNLPSGDPIKIAGAGLGATFTLTQFHFHWGPDNTLGSEHLIDSVAAPLEVIWFIETQPVYATLAKYIYKIN